MFGEPECRWGQGAAVVERDAELVGLLVTFDGVESGRGWSYDAYVQPGDPDERDLIDVLVRTGLEVGQRRWADAAAAGEVAPAGLVAKLACYPSESDVRAVLAELGFVEDRRFWRMIVEHDGPAEPVRAAGRLLVAGRPRRRRGGPAPAVRGGEHMLRRPLRLHATAVRPMVGSPLRRDGGPDSVAVRRAATASRQATPGAATGTRRRAWGMWPAWECCASIADEAWPGRCCGLGSPTTATGGARAPCCTSTRPTPPARSGCTSPRGCGWTRSTCSTAARCSTERSLRPPGAASGPGLPRWPAGTARARRPTPSRAPGPGRDAGRRRRHPRRRGSRAAGPRGS